LTVEEAFKTSKLISSDPTDLHPLEAASRPNLLAFRGPIGLHVSPRAEISLHALAPGLTPSSVPRKVRAAVAMIDVPPDHRMAASYCSITPDPNPS